MRLAQVVKKVRRPRELSLDLRTPGGRALPY
jgi:hypothetical protein